MRTRQSMSREGRKRCSQATRLLPASTIDSALCTAQLAACNRVFLSSRWIFQRHGKKRIKALFTHLSNSPSTSIDTLFFVWTHRRGRPHLSEHLYFQVALLAPPSGETECQLSNDARPPNVRISTSGNSVDLPIFQFMGVSIDCGGLYPSSLLPRQTPARVWQVFALCQQVRCSVRWGTYQVLQKNITFCGSTGRQRSFAGWWNRGGTDCQFVSER